MNDRQKATVALKSATFGTDDEVSNAMLEAAILLSNEPDANFETIFALLAYRDVTEMLVQLEGDTE